MLEELADVDQKAWGWIGTIRKEKAAVLVDAGHRTYHNGREKTSLLQARLVTKDLGQGCDAQPYHQDILIHHQGRRGTNNWVEQILEKPRLKGEGKLKQPWEPPWSQVGDVRGMRGLAKNQMT